jgi:hypothetical protein
MAPRPPPRRPIPRPRLRRRSCLPLRRACWRPALLLHKRPQIQAHETQSNASALAQDSAARRALPGSGFSVRDRAWKGRSCLAGCRRGGFQAGRARGFELLRVSRLDVGSTVNMGVFVGIDMRSVASPPSLASTAGRKSVPGLGDAYPAVLAKPRERPWGPGRSPARPSSTIPAGRRTTGVAIHSIAARASMDRRRHALCSRRRAVEQAYRTSAVAKG